MNIAESSVPDCSLLSATKNSNIGNTGHNKTKRGTFHKLKIEIFSKFQKFAHVYTPKTCCIFTGQKYVFTINLVYIKILNPHYL